MFSRHLCLIVLLILFSEFLIAQNKGHFSFGFTPGLMSYQGDISGDFPDMRTTHFCAGIDFAYKPGNLLKFAIGYTFGKLSGADSLVPNKEKRNFQFYTNIHDFHLLTYVNLNVIRRKIWPNKILARGDFEPGFTGPDFILGVGFMHFNPKGKWNGTEYQLQKLGTEGQNIPGGSYGAPYSLWQFNIKYGFGLGYNLGRQLNIEFQIIYSQTFTDYLDDVSGEYPDFNKLKNTANGDAATYFSYGGKDESEVNKENPRGNPGKNDGFMTLGFKISYTFSRSEFGRIMNL